MADEAVKLDTASSASLHPAPSSQGEGFFVARSIGVAFLFG